jgi:hypothetical protein
MVGQKTPPWEPVADRRVSPRDIGMSAQQEGARARRLAMQQASPSVSRKG